MTEPGTELAQEALFSAEELVSSRVTYPEARAALAAAARGGRITRAELALAKRGLRMLMDGTDVVELDAAVADQAGELAERYSLRGFDAVHLASALASNAEQLLSWDSDLVRAAKSVGLPVVGWRAGS